MAEWIPHTARFVPGTALGWSVEDAETAMRTRLRIAARPSTPNRHGLVGFAYYVVALPSLPDGQEVPVAAATAVISLN